MSKRLQKVIVNFERLGHNEYHPDEWVYVKSKAAYIGIGTRLQMLGVWQDVHSLSDNELGRVFHAGHSEVLANYNTEWIHSIRAKFIGPQHRLVGFKEYVTYDDGLIGSIRGGDDYHFSASQLTGHHQVKLKNGDWLYIQEMSKGADTVSIGGCVEYVDKLSGRVRSQRACVDLRADEIVNCKVDVISVRAGMTNANGKLVKLMKKGEFPVISVEHNYGPNEVVLINGKPVPLGEAVVLRDKIVRADEICLNDVDIKGKQIQSLARGVL